MRLLVASESLSATLERLAEATHLDGVMKRFLGRLTEEQIGQLAGIWRDLLGETIEPEYNRPGER